MGKGNIPFAERLRRGYIEYYPKTPVYHFKFEDYKELVARKKVVELGTTPLITDMGVYNESGKKFALNFADPAVQAVLESGSFTLIVEIHSPVGSDDLAEGVYKLFGDVIYIKKEGAAVTLNCFDGTHTATCATSWAADAVVTGVVQVVDGVMRIARGEAM